MRCFLANKTDDIEGIKEIKETEIEDQLTNETVNEESDDEVIWEDATAADFPEGHKSGFVAVVGRPNAGKSTLLNALLGQKIAIVSHRPQTTRTRQLGIVTDEEKYQVVFVDTPGIMKKALHKLDEFMLETAVEALNDGDIVLWIVDASQPPTAEDKIIGEMVAKASGTVLLVMNKNDLVPIEQALDRTAEFRVLVPEQTEWFFISSEHKRGVSDLFDTIIKHLPLGPRYYPPEQITETFVRDIVSEMIREQLLLQLREEIPHGTAVQINDFKEEETPLRIRATIFVERDSHKRIAIGQNGRMLKKIGTQARYEIEKLLDKQVFLDLWVKVAPKWRTKENLLKRFGYAEG